MYTVATDGPCSDNFCCTSAYIDKLRDSIQVNVFKECIRERFSKVLEIADDFFDDFNGILYLIILIYCYTCPSASDHSIATRSQFIH